MTERIDTPQFATRWQQAQERPVGLVGKARRLLRRGAITGAAQLAELTGQANATASLRLLFCHYVFDNQRAAFEAQLKQLQGIGEFVSTARCLQMLRGQVPIERPSFHLSFDDGFANIATNAAPIMKRLGITGTFFVPTSIIGADYQTVRHFCLDVTQYRAVVELASWEQLGRLAEQGIDIASHTRTHTRFSDMSADRSRMEDEIFGSKADIERELGLPCPYISWPYGRLSDADDRSLALVQEAGYEACFGAWRGQIRPGKTDPFNIPRHHFEPEWPLAHVRYFARGAREEPVS